MEPYNANPDDVELMASNIDEPESHQIDNYKRDGNASVYSLNSILSINLPLQDEYLKILNDLVHLLLAIGVFHLVYMYLSKTPIRMHEMYIAIVAAFLAYYLVVKKLIVITRND